MTDCEDLENGRENLKVFVRILPLENPCDACARIDANRKTIYVPCLQDSRRNGIATLKEPSYWSFRTDGIFHNSSQDEVYSCTAEDFVEKASDGVDCTLIGHGQTGSGKSFTVAGLRNNWEHRGLVARLLADMFADRAGERRPDGIRCRLSYVELRGRRVTDLLRPDGESAVKVCARDAFKNVTLVSVASEEEALRRIFEGEARRSIAKRSAYPASHLGTAVITFHVFNPRLSPSRAVVASAKIHVVEMAGTGTIGGRFSSKAAPDVGAANLTRAHLERFLVDLRRSGAAPRSTARISDLLKLLGRALRVTSVVRIIGHLRVTKEELDSVLSTLRFGAKVANLRPTKVLGGTDVSCLGPYVTSCGSPRAADPFPDEEDARANQSAELLLHGCVRDMPTIESSDHRIRSPRVPCGRVKLDSSRAPKGSGNSDVEEDREQPKERVGVLEKTGITLGPMLQGVAMLRATTRDAKTSSGNLRHVFSRLQHTMLRTTKMDLRSSRR